MREKVSVFAKIFKEAVAEGQVKYKEMSNEVTKGKLFENKQLLENKKNEIIELNKRIAMTEKDIAYHQMRQRTFEEEKAVLEIEKYDDELYLGAMTKIDRVQKDIDYHVFQITSLEAKLTTEEAKLEELKQELFKEERAHTQRVERLIREEELLEMKKAERIKTVTN